MTCHPRLVTNCLVEGSFLNVTFFVFLIGAAIGVAPLTGTSVVAGDRSGTTRGAGSPLEQVEEEQL